MTGNPTEVFFLKASTVISYLCFARGAIELAHIAYLAKRKKLDQMKLVQKGFMAVGLILMSIYILGQVVAVTWMWRWL